jgi:hypothetical protein
MECRAALSLMKCNEGRSLKLWSGQRAFRLARTCAAECTLDMRIMYIGSVRIEKSGLNRKSASLLTVCTSVDSVLVNGKRCLELVFKYTQEFLFDGPHRDALPSAIKSAVCSINS